MTASIWLPPQLNTGAFVKKGDQLLVLEAMKMEISIVAPEDGQVVWINPICTERGTMTHQGDHLFILKLSTERTDAAKTMKVLFNDLYSETIEARAPARFMI